MCVLALAEQRKREATRNGLGHVDRVGDAGKVFETSENIYIESMAQNASSRGLR